MASIYDPVLVLRRVDPLRWKEFDGQKFLGLHRDEETWLREFMKIQLSPDIPAGIQSMFESSRGAMIYAWFYYPLATVGMEHCYRTLELAVKVRSGEKGTKKTFEKNLQWLHEAGVITEKDMIRWNAVRSLRNFACHPDGRRIADPGEALNQLRTAAELIAMLFPCAS